MSRRRGEVKMLAGSDFVVIAMAILALAFFVWYAVTGAAKGREPDQAPTAGQRTKRPADAKRSET
jgi:hypothetical protein